LPFDQPRAHDDGVDSEHLPNDEVVVMMVDDGGDATIWVDLQELWSLLLLLAEVEVHGFIGQPKLFENDSDFPKSRVGFQVTLRG